METENDIPQTAVLTCRQCLCAECRLSRQIALVRNYGNASAKNTMIDYLYERMCMAEFDNDYWGAINDGSWPNARGIAEGIIERCDAQTEPKNAH